MNNKEMNMENNDNSLQVLFEQIASCPDRFYNLRQCREMRVPSNIGGGYFCQWYYYRTLDNRHMLIFRSYRSYGESFTYSGREIDEIPTSFGLYGDIIDIPEIPIDSHISSFDELMDIQNQPHQQ